MASDTSKDLFDLEGRTAIVTGAGSGLGYRHAVSLAKRGVRVAAVGGHPEGLARLEQSFGAAAILPIELDVTDAPSVANAIEAVVSWRGSIDGLVNNAGITIVKPPEEETPDDFRAVIDVNLQGTFNFCHYVGRHMLGRGSGAIVNIASINGIVASLGEAGYCASKGAVISLTRELAAQWAPRGVRVNAIAPGYFRSPMTEPLYETTEGLAFLGQAPMGRAGREEELDGPLAFLLSEAASYVTGHTLVVDGGWTIV